MIFGRKSESGRGLGWVPEAMVITAAAPVVGSLVNPADPYLLHSPFPWLLLAPLAVALQHGLWAGLTSSSVLIGLAGWQVLSGDSVPASFMSWSIGCTLTALIAGQIRDSVRGRTEKLTKRADHLQDRLERSERTRHLIQLSHAKLEERVVSSRSSLAGAIEDAERRMSGGHSMPELAQVLLDVLAAQGHLHAATLYVAARDQGLLLAEPVASFGGTGASSARHALVVRAFQTAKLAAVVDAIEAVRNDSSVLAAVPLITARRRTVGVVAVHQMPFMMFHADHLNQIFVLAGHLTDLLFDRWSEVHGGVRSEHEGLAVSQSVSAERSVIVEPNAYEPMAAATRSSFTANAGVSTVAASTGKPAATTAASTATVRRDLIETRETASVVGIFDRGSAVVRETLWADMAASASAAESARLVRKAFQGARPAVEQPLATNTVHTREVVSPGADVSARVVREAFQGARLAVEAPVAANTVQARVALSAGARESARVLREAVQSVRPAVEEPVAANAALAGDTHSVDRVQKRAKAESKRNRKRSSGRGARKARAAADQSVEREAAIPPTADATSAFIPTATVAAATTLAVAATTHAASAPSPIESALAVATSTTSTPAPIVAAHPVALTAAGDVVASFSVTTSSVHDAAGAAPVTAATTPKMNQSKKTTRDSKPKSRTDARSTEVVDRDSRETSEASRPREVARTLLPPPVENARTAILAAFARKANAPESDGAEITRPLSAATFRFTRADGRARSAAPATGPAAVRPSAPAVAEATEPAAPAAPAKAEDARASVRAAFQKARGTASSAPPAIVTPAAKPRANAKSRRATASVATPTVQATERAIAPASAERASPQAARQLEEPRVADGPAIEAARKAMLATLTKARSMSPKAPSGRSDAANATVSIPVENAAEAAQNAPEATTAQATHDSPNPTAAKDRAQSPAAHVTAAAIANDLAHASTTAHTQASAMNATAERSNERTADEHSGIVRIASATKTARVQTSDEQSGIVRTASATKAAHAQNDSQSSAQRPRTRTKTLEMPAVTQRVGTGPTASAQGATLDIDIEIEVELTVAHSSDAAPSTARKAGAQRRSQLPLPPAPAGFAALKSVAGPTLEPRSRTQPTRPLTETVVRSSEAL